jgi:hypothetical protein
VILTFSQLVFIKNWIENTDPVFIIHLDEDLGIVRDETPTVADAASRFGPKRLQGSRTQLL